MKRFILALSIVFLLFSCDTEPMNEEINPFIGEWVHENGQRNIFTDTIYTCIINNDVVWATGPYTYNNTHLFIVVDKEKSSTNLSELVYSYVFNNDKLYWDGVPTTKKPD